MELFPCGALNLGQGVPGGWGGCQLRLGPAERCQIFSELVFVQFLEGFCSVSFFLGEEGGKSRVRAVPERSHRLVFSRVCGWLNIIYIYNY